MVTVSSTVPGTREDTKSAMSDLGLLDDTVFPVEANRHGFIRSVDDQTHSGVLPRRNVV